MNHAFLFDMDGVLIDTEHAWEPLEMPMLERLLGKQMAEKLGSTVGLSIRLVYEKAHEMGSSVTFDDVFHAYDDLAATAYSNAKITPDSNELISALRNLEFKIGLVTASPKTWMDRYLKKAGSRELFDTLISIYERMDLKTKPAPDGYLEALRQLSAEAGHSFILEDSNTGIRAGKAAGARVIGFRGNLLNGYLQSGADEYADSMKDILKIIEKNAL
jgi:HAD superfamily hydrolase (TIGR01509 family)